MNVQVRLPASVPAGQLMPGPGMPPTVLNTNTILVLGNQPSGHGFVVRALWFLFVGWWLSGNVISLGGLAMVTVIGLPLAFWLFNRVPQAQTLRPRTMN